MPRKLTVAAAQMGPVEREEGRSPVVDRLLEMMREAHSRGADLVVTDVWSSIGHEQDQARRREAFSGYQVDTKMLDLARDDALLMHCLPAHRGEEVSETIMDDPRSVVWQEAGNRLHSQKALLEWLLTESR